mmetsp:Transcript_50414/g.141061  ORF Transcript_50414/g.141061 Transcript_50414/m.141061 type:complete len:339 (+) Transcript_50414:91-1107(+)
MSPCQLAPGFAAVTAAPAGLRAIPRRSAATTLRPSAATCLARQLPAAIAGIACARSLGARVAKVFAHPAGRRISRPVTVVAAKRDAATPAASPASEEALARRTLLGQRLLGTLASGAVVFKGGAAVAADVKEDEVVDVVDGDTVKLAGAGRCRLIGINTPETVAPAQKNGAAPECYGPEASALMKQLVTKGMRVRVEYDAGPADRYGRGLVYLYRAQDGLFVNAELVKQGAARHLTVAPNLRYDDEFKRLEKEASSAGRGLWKACAVGSAAASPATGAAPAGLPGSPGNSKNCKDFSSYEEAKAWFDAYFPLYGDVAKLDGDGDGKPCESLLRRKKKN